MHDGVITHTHDCLVVALAQLLLFDTNNSVIKANYLAVVLPPF